MRDKIVFEKVAGKKCSACCFYSSEHDSNPCDILKINCTCIGGQIYKLAEEEQVKIQTEYEWATERHALLCSLPMKERESFLTDIAKVQSYLRENKPTNFVTCTRENTKVSDKIRANGKVECEYEVKYIYDSGINFVAECYNGYETLRTLEYYEIDLNNTEE